MKYNTFRAKGNRTAVNFGKLYNINAFGRFGLAILLDPPSKEEALTALQNGILPHSHSPLSL